MTCPCKGDLCNGVKTERENEAFASLAKLVAKTRNARIKKRGVTPSSNFINARSNSVQTTTPSLENDIVNRTDNMTHNETTELEMQTEQLNVTNFVNETTNAKSENKDNEIDETKNENQTELHTTAMSNINEKTSDLTTPIQETVATLPATKEVITNDINLTNSSTNLSVLPSAGSANDANNDIMLNDGQRAQDLLATTENRNMIANVKPSESLPTAEALQQNASPQVTTDTPVTTTEAITTAAVTTQGMMTTKSNVMVTPASTKPSKNGAYSSSISLLTIVNSVFLYSVI